MSDANTSIISELNGRSREIFREIVEAYVEDGTPVGSRTPVSYTHLRAHETDS